MNFVYQSDILDEILEFHRPELGRDFQAYTNHCYRVFNLTYLHSDKSQISIEKIAIACAFHDLGIWVNNTFDYIVPSQQMAQLFLIREGKSDWINEILDMIGDHHKISKSDRGELVETFRKADWVDVSIGLLTKGFDRSTIKSLYKAFPVQGFHWRLFQFSLKNIIKNPLNPLPMFKL